MAQVPRAYVDAFTRSLGALSADMRARLGEALMKVDFSAPVADVREACIAAMELFCGPCADMAAELAAEFYDGLREMATGARLGALAESGRVAEATEGAVRAIMQGLVDGMIAEGVQRKLLDRADYEVKRAAGECVYRNGQRDPLEVRYARVPTGGETCSFCIMLASRGFVYRSEETAGKGGHYHPNCDCRIVPGFEGEKSSVEGYDPDRYYDMWKHPEKYAEKGENGATMSGMEQNESLVKMTKSRNSLSVSPVVNSKEYHDAFEAMPLPKPVTQSVYEQAGRILGKTDGTDLEHMVAINVRTGAVVADNLGRTAVPRATGFTSTEAAGVLKCQDGVVIVHNHPASKPPSYRDLITAARNGCVAASVVVGHDGSVWYVSADNPEVADRLEGYYNGYKDFVGDFAEVRAVDALLASNKGRRSINWRRLR